MTASWCLRSWLSGVSAAAVGCTAFAAPTAVVECTPRDDAAGRVYQVVDRGDAASPRWVLTLRSRRLGARTVELPLPDARVERTAAGVSIASRSGNGGLTVSVRAANDDSMLDVFVNFELEVNVWRDLSPDVEQMNTEGPIALAQCRPLSAGDSLP